MLRKIVTPQQKRAILKCGVLAGKRGRRYLDKARLEGDKASLPSKAHVRTSKKSAFSFFDVTSKIESW